MACRRRVPCLFVLFSGFGLALLLGGSRYATVEVEIYQLVMFELDMAVASVLVWLAGVGGNGGGRVAVCVVRQARVRIRRFLL